MTDPTRVTAYLGGTGANNQGRINVHPSLHRVGIGGDGTPQANLHVFGTAIVDGSFTQGWNVQSANVTGVVGQKYAANTNAGSWLFRLPNTADFGSEIVVADVFATWDTNPLIVWVGGGSTIRNVTDNLICDFSTTVTFVYFGSGVWDIY